MRKLGLSFLLTLVVFAAAVVPALADRIGPTP